MSHKGLSQILYLIIAASVMMMVALSLFFAFNNSFDSGSQDSCRASIQSQCSLVSENTNSIPIPSSCKDGQGQAYISVTGVERDRVNCQALR